ncbi:MAG: hypothetical protein P8Z78_08285 [Gammaproteobacteria bacterium]|jgi:hypothetical protein
MKSLKYVIGKSMLAFTLAFANYANADGITLPAGYACADFSLTINITPGDHYVIKEWTDEYGNPVRMLTAGRGADLEFINEDTGATYATMGNGSVSHTTFNPDGSSSVSAEGHNILILFPTDLPPGVGPSTKQYIGRVMYTVDTFGTWELQSVRGKTTDICAALSER